MLGYLGRRRDRQINHLTRHGAAMLAMSVAYKGIMVNHMVRRRCLPRVDGRADRLNQICRAGSVSGSQQGTFKPSLEGGRLLVVLLRARLKSLAQCLAILLVRNRMLGPCS